MLMELIRGGQYEKILVLDEWSIYEQVKTVYKYSSVEYVEEYRLSPLSKPLKSYDLIIGGDVFGNVINVKDMAAGLAQYLKSTGSLAFYFENARYAGRLVALMEGWLNPNVQYFSRDGMKRVLMSAFYKSFEFMGKKKDAPVMGLEKVGFKNYSDDLKVIRWYVLAHRSTEETYQLKQVQSQEWRNKFAKLIHRIEYGVEVENSVAEFRRMSTEVFGEYVADFVESICIDKEAFYRNLNGGFKSGDE